jgi:hypothetical protein
VFVVFDGTGTALPAPLYAIELSENPNGIAAKHRLGAPNYINADRSALVPSVDCFAVTLCGENRWPP